MLKSEKNVKYFLICMLFQKSFVYLQRKSKQNKNGKKRKYTNEGKGIRCSFKRKF